MKLKFADTEVWGEPTHSAQRAKAILADAYAQMQPDLSSTINPSFTKGQVHGIFSEAVIQKLPDGSMHPSIARNIEREFGSYYRGAGLGGA